ncbi:hypothetical protein SP90_01560 [Halodesulfovibrio spirochaetisodalis]|uniref:HTH lysR-type domain-containing protein n=2 Tax=Halodesulfovibrio spirochaetisodalis TaxID=1560234 RepID=A0A1B7XMQ9_9BACT|nr:hypothetical protein SP90_01560 [Halodesulfovibrio spirochaetisodalis]
MELHQLIGFYHIVKLGSFTRAAEATFRTQSALSQQIKKLEQELSVTLFERIGKQGVQLTDEGHRVFEFTEKLVRNKEELLDDLAELKGDFTGRVSVAAPLAIMQCYLPPILEDFKAKYPTVSLYLKHMNPQKCIDDVLSGAIDIALVHGSTVPGNLEQTPWRAGEYALMVPKGHELTKQIVTLEDIVRFPLILPQKNVKFSARSLLDAMLDEAGLSYKVVMESPNVQLNAEYVSRGLGISCILSYEPFREMYKDTVDFIILNHIFPKENVSIIQRRGNKVQGVKQTLLTHILES